MASIKGYREIPPEDIELVNKNKEQEERILRQLEGLAARHDTDKRWVAIARTHIEQGFGAMNRAILRPDRVTLPEDAIQGEGVASS